MNRNRPKNYGKSAVIEGRTCRVCGGDRFYSFLSKTHANGVRYRCVACTRRAALKWAKLHPEVHQKARRKWIDNNRNYWKRRSWALKLEVFCGLGGSCVCCSESDLRFLTVDHLNRGGAEHRREVGADTDKVYADIKRQGYPRDKFRILCWNCHMATRFGEPCPHVEQGIARAE